MARRTASPQPVRRQKRALPSRMITRACLPTLLPTTLCRDPHLTAALQHMLVPRIARRDRHFRMTPCLKEILQPCTATTPQLPRQIMQNAMARHTTCQFPIRHEVSQPRRMTKVRWLNNRRSLARTRRLRISRTAGTLRRWWHHLTATRSTAPELRQEIASRFYGAKFMKSICMLHACLQRKCVACQLHAYFLYGPCMHEACMHHTCNERVACTAFMQDACNTHAMHTRPWERPCRSCF